MLLLVVFWLLVAYLVLPRLHRMLTYLYVPDYFIGRTRTSDGLLGDPVNLALLGDEAQVHAAMAAAGWTRADDVTLASSLKIVRTTLSRRSYPEAPVSPLHLFERQQDFAYQQEVEGNPSQRHHVRFWRCPEGWLLPGRLPGRLGGGRHLRPQRRPLADDLPGHPPHRQGHRRRARPHRRDRSTVANPGVDVDRIRHFASGYHARNGGGDEIVTDGDLPVLDLRRVDAPAEARVAAPTDSRDKRPASTVFSAGVAGLRGLVGVVIAGLLFADPEHSTALTPNATVSAVLGTAVAFLVVAALDVGAWGWPPSPGATGRGCC